MKRRHKTGGYPCVRRRETREQERFRIYRRHRFDQKIFFYDPLYSLNHSLSVDFMQQECNYYGYTFTGYDTSPMEQGYRMQNDYDAVEAAENEGIIVVKGEGIHKRFNFNRYVYTHTSEDTAKDFITEVLYPTFDEIAQRRISKKKAHPRDREQLLHDLEMRKCADFPEFNDSGSDYYFWPIYDLLESIACTIPHITKWHTHQDIMLSTTITISSGLQYYLEVLDRYDVEKCLALFNYLVKYEQADLAQDDDAATAMANDLIKNHGYYPMNRQTVIIQEDSADFDSHNPDQYRRQLLTTVLKHSPIPVPTGFILCDTQNDIDDEESMATLQQLRLCNP